jgi:Protein of unknown function (DUF3341)
MQPGVLAEFADAATMLEGLKLLRENGYRRLESYTPYPVDGVAERLGLSPSRLPKLTFAGGLLGALAGYLIQWYANVYDYPYNVGGRPVHPVPAFIPSTFEAAVLGAALAAFVLVFLLNRLPALWHPAFEVEGFERAFIDRYWIGIERVEDRLDLDHVQLILAPAVPLRLVPVPAAP